MRLFVLLLLIAFLAAGILLGALNADLVAYDLGFARMQLPKGAALLGGVVVGWLLGGLTAWIGVSSSHRRQRHAADKKPAANA